MVTVCTQGECYQTVIISQTAICPPNRSLGEKKSFIISIPELAPIKSYIWFSFHSVPWGTHTIILCQCHTTFSPLQVYLFTCVFLFYLILLPPFPLVWQWCGWPVAYSVLRGSAVPVSSAGVWMRCIGGVHSWRVSHHDDVRKMLNKHIHCLHQIHKNWFWKNLFFHHPFPTCRRRKFYLDWTCEKWTK